MYQFGLKLGELCRTKVWEFSKLHESSAARRVQFWKFSHLRPTQRTQFQEQSSSPGETIASKLVHFHRKTIPFRNNGTMGRWRTLIPERKTSRKVSCRVEPWQDLRRPGHALDTAGAGPGHPHHVRCGPRCDVLVLGGPCQCRSALGRVCWVGCVGMAALRNHRDRRDASFWVRLDTKYTKGVQFSYSVNLKFHFYKRGISDLDCSKIQHPYAQYQ